MKWLLIFIALVINTSSYAAVYMQKNANGDISYSDTPSENAKIIDVPPTDSTTSAPAPATTVTTTDTNTSAVLVEENAQTERKPYTLFAIESPKDQETIQSQPSIIVSFKIEPALQMGDQIQLYVDDKPWGPATKNKQVNVDLLERGTHQLYAKLIDNQLAVLKQTSPITIFVHRTSSITSPAFKARTENENYNAFLKLMHALGISEAVNFVIHLPNA